MMWPLLALLLAQSADPIPGAQLDSLVGDWDVVDESGASGHSSVIAQAPGLMLYEVRDVGPDGPLPIWFEYSERTHSWVQLFPGPAGIREFQAISPPGQWPLLFGGDVVLQDGSSARFRLTMTQPSPDLGTRRLEMSRDGGSSWRTAFAYTYRRVRASAEH
jgi:hypothetical protein